jgi:hypothetical protein
VNGFEKQSAKMGAASWLSTERDSRSKTLKWSEYWPSVRMAMFWKTNQIPGEPSRSARRVAGLKRSTPKEMKCKEGRGGRSASITRDGFANRRASNKRRIGTTHSQRRSCPAWSSPSSPSLSTSLPSSSTRPLPLPQYSFPLPDLHYRSHSPPYNRSHSSHANCFPSPKTCQKQSS